MEAPPVNFTMSMPEDPAEQCFYPSYFSYFMVLVLVAACLPTQLSHLFKAIVLVLLALAMCGFNLVFLAPALDSEEFINHRDFTK